MADFKINHQDDDQSTKIGAGTAIRLFSVVSSGAKIEKNCNINFTNGFASRSKQQPLKLLKTPLRHGVSLVAHSTVIGGLTIGKYEMIGAGSEVTINVLDYALVDGNPSQPKGYVCDCGTRLIDLFCKCCCKSYSATNNVLSKTRQNSVVNDHWFYGLIQQSAA